MSESADSQKTTEQVDSRILHKSTAEVLHLGKDQRIDAIWELKHNWIPYPLASSIFRDAEQLLRRAPADRLPCILVEGPPNGGKTALYKRYLAKHPVDENLTGESTIAPVVGIQVKGPDESFLYDSLLSKVKAPCRPSDKVLNKLHQVLTIFRKIGIRQLLLDEVNAAISGSHLNQKKYLGSLKFLANELQLTILATGTTDATLALAADDQVSTRFKIRYTLTKWSYGTDFRRLLESFEQRLPLHEASDLQEPRLARLILNLSGGRMGDVAELIMQAAVHAIECNKEKIDSELLTNLRIKGNSED